MSAWLIATRLIRAFDTFIFGKLKELNMRNHPQLFLVLALWIACMLGCVTTGERSNLSQPSSSPEKVLSSGYKKLTYQSTYYDVVNAMGTPDAEISTGPPKAVIPNVWMAYKKCGCMVFLIYGKQPKKGVFDKSTTRYVGTKGTDPEKTLHVAEERFRILLDSLPLH